MSLAALLVAILSLVVAASALGWQIISWRMNGGRVKLQLVHGVVNYETGGVIHTPIGQAEGTVDLERLRAKGWHGPEVLGVEVANIGRAGVQVTGVALLHPTSGVAMLFPGESPLAPKLPQMVQPGTTETWFLDLESGRAMVEAANTAEQLRGRALQLRVTLGTGKTLVTKGSFKV